MKGVVVLPSASQGSNLGGGQEAAEVRREGNQGMDILPFLFFFLWLFEQMSLFEAKKKQKTKKACARIVHLTIQIHHFTTIF